MTLTKTGAGTQVLSGANTYTGDTTLTAGTLTLGANNTLPDTTDLTISTSQAPNQDHDNDGVQNGIEHFLGGSTNTTGRATLPGVRHALLPPAVAAGSAPCGAELFLLGPIRPVMMIHRFLVSAHPKGNI